MYDPVCEDLPYNLNMPNHPLGEPKAVKIYEVKPLSVLLIAIIELVALWLISRL